MEYTIQEAKETNSLISNLFQLQFFNLYLYTVIERKSSGKAMYKILPPTCKH